jgi:H+/Cl- antiporter ClcA
VSKLGISVTPIQRASLIGLIYEVFRRILGYVSLSILVGSFVAFFLWSLDRVTEIHWQHPWLLYCLPVIGLISGLLYQYYGQNSEGGNNLIIEQIHQPGGGVPVRMAPLVLIGTLLTHLGGGSAGREGTAVQMGGSLAGLTAHWLGMTGASLRPFLTAGVAAGFGAVFGTPIAGAIFALEILVRGRIEHHSIIPCLSCAILADQVTLLWGIEHTTYSIVYFSNEVEQRTGWGAGEWWLLLQVLLASCIFGLVSRLFIWASHTITSAAKKWITRGWMRPVVGGVIIVALAVFLDGREYLGLGVNANPSSAEPITIPGCFRAGGATHFSWILKLAFTAITVGMAFKGGEVTPLFFIGAALGNSLGVMLGAPIDVMAALGFLAVFAGATKTPIACMVMGIELFAPHSEGLFSGHFFVYAAVACFVAYYTSGRESIYRAQKKEFPFAN